ncbi:homeotic protein ultrabithorax isoform X3 [Cimex lectularius]|uniref:Ultrabithorax n=1 Tax=Cimex lectularius TaxID=79782 RepID=A0A8I6TMB9_CIMLE|nr:homeotic protein ultrabithorax isoform X3 [Cimex lectularius]
MNSYFEQTGFYGSHHHQSSTAAHHHDQTAAAYRFPLGLGMSPYASSQHHHHHSLHQSRPPQDSPYDASVAAACKLYSATNDNQTSVNYSTTKPDCSKTEGGHQNGYAAVVAAAAKDVWQSASAGSTPSANPLVRPSACTPDSRYPGLTEAAGGSPGSASRTSASSLAPSWNQCSINTASSQAPVGTQIHQQAGNHTFYPWMAIAGKSDSVVRTTAIYHQISYYFEKRSDLHNFLIIHHIQRAIINQDYN